MISIKHTRKLPALTCQYCGTQYRMNYAEGSSKRHCAAETCKSSDHRQQVYEQSIKAKTRYQLKLQMQRVT